MPDQVIDGSAHQTNTSASPHKFCFVRGDQHRRSLCRSSSP